MIRRLILTTVLAASAASAQLAPAQRVQEFENLVNFYARSYAPAFWKLEAFGFNLFDARPWMLRVLSARNDLEFFEICMEYVASLRDGHSRFQMPSNFSATLGLNVDFYEGRLLIESINRVRYPADRFPFQIGDELVSVDGRSAVAIVDELTRLESFADPRTTRRGAAAKLTARGQWVFPQTANVPESSEVVIRRASGELETYRLTWAPSAFSRVFAVQPTPPTPRAPDSRPLTFDEPDAPVRAIAALGERRISPEQLRSFESANAEGDETKLRILGWGVVTPYYQLPAGFVVRRGLAVGDAIFSGTFESGGRRLGLIRIPGFPSTNIAANVRNWDAEIRYLQANTDGLILDVTRNTGGGCIGMTYARRLFTERFYFGADLYRPSRSIVQGFEAELNFATANRVPEWMLEYLRYTLTALREAEQGRSALTGPLASCAPVGDPYQPPTVEVDPIRDVFGEVVAYTKPMILLVDDLTVSFGDLFASVFQDNRRGPVVGIKTPGYGGFVGGQQSGFYSGSFTSTSLSVGVRSRAVSAPGLPTAPWLENIGVVPDIPLDYMTRENLITNGRPFVAEFTRLMLEEIARPRP